MARLKIYEYILSPEDNGSHYGELLFEDYRVQNGDEVKMIGMTKSEFQPLPELKDPITIDYAEEDGERVLVNTKRKSFEYEFTLTFLLTKSFERNEVNKIAYNLQSDIQGKHIAVFNLDTEQEMVGYITKAFEPDDPRKKEIGVNYRDLMDCKVTLSVNDPSLCNYKDITRMPEDESL